MSVEIHLAFHWYDDAGFPVDVMNKSAIWQIPTTPVESSGLIQSDFGEPKPNRRSCIFWIDRHSNCGGHSSLCAAQNLWAD